MIFLIKFISMWYSASYLFKGFGVDEIHAVVVLLSLSSNSDFICVFLSMLSAKSGPNIICISNGDLISISVSSLSHLSPHLHIYRLICISLLRCFHEQILLEYASTISYKLNIFRLQTALRILTTQSRISTKQFNKRVSRGFKNI